MALAIYSGDVPALLGLNPFMPRELATVRVLLRQRTPASQALRGEDLVQRVFGEVCPYSCGVEAALAGREGRVRALGCNGFVIYGVPVVVDRSVVLTKARRSWFQVPPSYDLVHLHVLMRLSGASTGWLVETKSEQYRETLACRSGFDWEAAAASLEQTVGEITDADLSTVMGWMDRGRLARKRPRARAPVSPK